MATRTLGQKILMGVGVVILLGLLAVGLFIGLITGAFNIQRTLTDHNHQEPKDRPVKVLFAAYPSAASQAGSLFEGEKGCTFVDCLNFAIVMDTDGTPYRFSFKKRYSGENLLISPNREHVFLPMDQHPMHFYRGAITPFDTEKPQANNGVALLSDHGTLIRHTTGEFTGTYPTDDTPPAMRFITDTSQHTEPFTYGGTFKACEGRVFYFGSPVEDRKVNTRTWHEFEVHPEAQTITPLNRVNELRDGEGFLARQCLGDGRGTQAMVTEREAEHTLLLWDPDPGVYQTEHYGKSDLFKPYLVHITNDSFFLANHDGEYERYDRRTQQRVYIGNLGNWDGRLNPYKSITRFVGDRAFVLGKVDLNRGNGPINLGWVGLEVDPVTREVHQRVRLPYFDETYPGEFSLDDLVITDGDAFSAWLATQPAYT